MRALVVKEFRELARDHRTVAMLVVLPVLLLVIFGYAANFTVGSVTATVVGPGAQPFADSLHIDGLDIVAVDPSRTVADAESLLREHDSDVVLAETDPATPGSPGPSITVDGSQLFTAQAAVRMFAPVLGPDAREQLHIAFNPDLKTSWVMVPGLIGLILTFIGTLITSIGLVREREAGTLEQLAVMPLRPSSIILGKIVPYFLLALLDMVIVSLLAVWLFGIPFRGNMVAFALAAVVFLFVVLGLGVLISTVSRTTGQAIQLAFMTVLPQVLLSGLIFPLDAMGAGVRWIGYLLPLTWFNQIAQGIMLRAAPVASLWLPFLVLTALAVVVFTGATIRMRRTLTHGGAR